MVDGSECAWSSKVRYIRVVLIDMFLAKTATPSGEEGH